MIVWFSERTREPSRSKLEVLSGVQRSDPCSNDEVGELELTASPSGVDQNGTQLEIENTGADLVVRRGSGSTTGPVWVRMEGSCREERTNPFLSSAPNTADMVACAEKFD